MNRRALLGTGAAAGLGLLAGCTGDGPGGAPDDGESGSPTQSPTPKPTRPTDASFDADEARCGQRTNEATVETETDDGYRVVVTGTTSASDPCHAAELESYDFDEAADELTLNVVTTETDDGDVCAQCIAEIDYEATVTFQNGLPETVVVRHDDEEVASAASDSSKPTQS